MPPTANLEQIGEEIQLDIVSGAPRDHTRARAVELVRLRRSQRIADLRSDVVTSTLGRRTGPGLRRSTPIRSGADAAASAELRVIDGRRVVWFRIAGGKHHGAIGVGGGATVERAVQLAGQLQIPLVGEFDTSGAELRDGVAALHAWGRLASSCRCRASFPRCSRSPARASPARSRARALRPRRRDDRGRVRVRDRARLDRRLHRRVGLGPSSVAARCTIAGRGGCARRARRGSGRNALSGSSRTFPTIISPTPPERARRPAAACTVPRVDSRAAPSTSYDVCARDRRHRRRRLPTRAARGIRTEPRDRARHARRPADQASRRRNQPAHRAGTLDIEASRKGCSLHHVVRERSTSDPSPSSARPTRTGSRPRMAGHDPPRCRAGPCPAALQSTVPRLCVVMRKAYGGARHRDGLARASVTDPHDGVAGSAGCGDGRHAPRIFRPARKRLRTLDAVDRAAAERDLMEEYVDQVRQPVPGPPGRAWSTR